MDTNTLSAFDRELLVAKLREAGLPQAFFTRKRNIDASKQLRRILAMVWTRKSGVKVSFKASEKKAATAIWA